MSSNLMSDSLNTGNLSGSSLTLNGVTTTGIATGAAAEEEDIFGNHLTDLITGGFLDLALYEIRKIIKRVDPNGTYFQDLTLVTPSLVNPYFNNQDQWVFDKWYIENQLLMGPGGYEINSIKFNRDIFIKNGRYLLCFVVNKLPSGRIDVLKNGEWVTSIRSTGTIYQEVVIEDIATDDIEIKYVDTALNEKIEIFSLSIHYICDRFYEYMQLKIKQLATVDTDNFVAKSEYLHTLDKFLAQFKAVTGEYLNRLNAHEHADNPHNITPEKIGAASKNHEHAGLVTEGEVGTIVLKKMEGYSLKDHKHENYISKEESDEFIRKILKEYIASIVSVDPITLVYGPEGMLPSRLAQTDISKPIAILLGSTVVHTPTSSFDITAGNITTNYEAIMHEAPKVFSADTELATIPAHLDEEHDHMHFRFTYHIPHRIQGYTIKAIGAQIKGWSVVSGNSTFIHKITNPTNFEIDGDEYKVEIYLDEITTFDSISFILEDIVLMQNVTEWYLKIEIMYNDFNLDQFGITKEKYQIAVPQHGANQILNMQESLEHTIMQPDVIVDNLPLYVFGGKVENKDEEDKMYDMTYFPPVYENSRKGANVFIDKFEGIEMNTLYPVEAYTHPAFGTLVLSEGTSAPDVKLSYIYNSGFDSWKSDGSTDQITIEQTIEEDDVVLCAYMLNWRLEDKDNIPDTWTLTIEGKNILGETITVVAGSMDKYYPFYSVEDDDIVYYEKIDTDITVKKVTLTMKTYKTDPIIHLNKFYMYFTKYFYNRAQNCMYKGLVPVSQICLGHLTHTTEHGWEATNLCYGKSCIIPVNHFEQLTPFADYSVPNPFFSQDVTATPQGYVFGAENSANLGAYITNVTADKIYLNAANSHECRYAINIVRSW